MKQLEVKRKQVEYLAMIAEIIIALQLEKRLGLEGLGIFLIPITIFYFFYILTACNIPDALGKMIRVKKSKGQFRNVQRIKTMALFSQLVVGAVGTALMLLLGSMLAGKAFHCTYAVLMVQILSPLVLLRCITSVFLGLAQGEGSELPAVITCILRVALVYGLGIFFGNMLQGYGQKVSDLLKQEHYIAMYTGAGWCIGIVCAEAVVALVAALSYLGTKKKKHSAEGEGMRTTDGFGTYITQCFQNTKYRIAIQLMEYFPIAGGMMLYYHKTLQKAEIGYGSYFTGYFSVCLLVLFFLHILTVPFWGKIGGFIRHDDMRQARTCFHGGIHLIFSLGLILCGTLSVMPMQIGALLGFTSPNLEKIMIPGSFWILFISLAFYFSRLLMRLGKSFLVLGISALHVVLYFMLFMILWKNGDMGLMALMYAGVIAGGVYAALLGALSKQLLGGKLPVVQMFGMPVILALIICLSEVLLVKFLYGFLGNLLTVVIIGGVGILLYFLGLVLLRSFYEEELRLMPGGGVLLMLGEMMEVF